MISIVSPVYMAEEVVEELVATLKEVLWKLGDYEIILIDDCSTDNSWKKIKDRNDIRIYRNECNIGQHATIRKGIMLAEGDWIVVMDCDLQDNPYEIPKLYTQALMGFDIVYARRTQIKQSHLRRFCSELFHKLHSFRRGKKNDPAVANFAIYRKGYFGKTDCKIETVDVVHCERFAGKSSYTLWKLIKLAIKLLR